MFVQGGAVDAIEGILKPNQVKSFVNENGDTLIAMRLDDAKVILADVLNYQIADSLVNLYELKDKENNNSSRFKEKKRSKIVRMTNRKIEL